MTQTHPDSLIQLGSSLRRMRCARQLTLEAAAQKAGIGRVTLNRWETGVQQPRTLDLRQFLLALEASPEERRALTALLINMSPRQSQTRDDLTKAGEKKGIGPMPHGGELIHAMRTRQGLSQEDAARLIGVTERTLRRWEKSEAWPATDQIRALCSALKARTEETDVLTKGQFLSLPEMRSSSLEELRMCGHKLCFYTDSGPESSLKELSFLMLESKVWPYALHSKAGERTLAYIYGYHAHYLSCIERFAESGIYAHRALDLWPAEGEPQPIHLMIGVTVARVAAYRGVRAAPLKGLEVLRSWLKVARGPQYEAWMLGDMAKYTAQAGNVTEGLALAQQAQRVAAHSENPCELVNRELDEAQILIWAGQVGRALERLHQRSGECSSEHAAKGKLLETEAYLSQNQRDVAYERLQEAWGVIESTTLLQLIPHAQRLAAHF